MINIPLGEGKVMIGAGKNIGLSYIVFAPSKVQYPIGELLPEEDLLDDQNAIVITMTNVESAKILLNALQWCIEKMEN